MLKNGSCLLGYMNWELRKLSSNASWVVSNTIMMVRRRKNKKASDALKMLRSSVEEILHPADCFSTKIPSCNDWFWTDLGKGFAAFLMPLQNATK